MRASHLLRWVHAGWEWLSRNAVLDGTLDGGHGDVGDAWVVKTCLKLPFLHHISLVILNTENKALDTCEYAMMPVLVCIWSIGAAVNFIRTFKYIVRFSLRANPTYFMRVLSTNSNVWLQTVNSTYAICLVVLTLVLLLVGLLLWVIHSIIGLSLL